MISFQLSSVHIFFFVVTCSFQLLYQLTTLSYVICLSSSAAFQFSSYGGLEANLDATRVPESPFCFTLHGLISNHWLSASQAPSPFMHKHGLVTSTLLGSTSKQREEPSADLLAICDFEFDVTSQLESGAVQTIPSFAGLPEAEACKQKYVPFTVKNFCGVYAHGSDWLQGPSLNGSVRDLRMTQVPDVGWKISNDDRRTLRTCPAFCLIQDSMSMLNR